MNRRSTIGIAVRVALLAGCLPGLAYAQASKSASSRDTAGESLLEEIVVTADRERSFGADLVQAGTFRGAELIDTPLTVSVLPRELLDAQQAMQLHDALRNTAGVTSAQLNNAVYSNMAVRGIVVENRGNYRLNGSLPIVNLIDLPLENKERVEVLKGVSALYYGFTTPAGIINLTTKRSPSNPLLDLTVYGNQHGSYGGHVDWGRRFADGKFGVRVNALLGNVDIGVDNTDGDRMFGSVALDFNPIESLSIQFDAERIEKKMSEPTTYFVTTPAGGAPPVLPPLPNPKRNLGGEWMYGDGWENNLLVNATWRFARDWALSLQAGRSELERDRFFSQMQNFNVVTGNGTVAVTLTNGNVNENENYRAELYGAFMTGPVKHEVTVGFTQNNRFAEVTTNPQCTFPRATANATCPASTFVPNLFVSNPLPFLPLPPREVANSSDIEDRGVYVFDRFSWEWLQVLAGLRHTDYESVTTRFRTSVTANPAAPTRYVADEVSPAFGVVVKPHDGLSLYATYIEGLEEGGVAAANAINNGEVLPPAISEQWEAGVKAELDRMLVTFAYFDIDRPSSFNRPVSPGSTQQVFVQEGRTTYQGYEASATGEISDQWSVFATAMWLNAEQKQTANGTLNGLRPENTPRFTGSLFAEYRLPAVPGLSVSGGVFYVGNRAINAQNAAIVGGYSTWDLGARYTRAIGGRDTTFRLYMDNVTNSRYWAATASSLLNPNLPRTIKASVTVRL
jgi:iron complex outermembrane receptor protein